MENGSKIVIFPAYTPKSTRKVGLHTQYSHLHARIVNLQRGAWEYSITCSYTYTLRDTRSKKRTPRDRALRETVHHACCIGSSYHAVFRMRRECEQDKNTFLGITGGIFFAIRIFVLTFAAVEILLQWRVSR